jgi:hypothetical protein
VVRLRVIGGTITIDDHVPATRAECIEGPRPCPHVKCRHHLWRVESDEQPGRRWPGYTPPAELRPVWLDWPLPPSCSLDEAERSSASGEEMPVADVARNMDVRETQTHGVLKRARRKLRELGNDAADLLPGDD